MTTTHKTDCSKNKDYDNNIALIYDYVEKSINTLRSNISDVTNKLGLLIGLEFTFMRFFLADLPGLSFSNAINNHNQDLLCYSCFILKALAYIFTLKSLVLCLWKGFITEPIKFIIDPDCLLAKADKGTMTQYKEAIIDTWKISVKEAKELLNIRSEALKQAIISLIISMIFAGLDIVIHFAFYRYLNNP